MSVFRSLNQTEIKTLEQAGCTASDWAAVKVAEGFDPRRVREVAFVGAVTIGALSGSVTLEGGVSLPAELRHATIVNCQIGNNVRINNVGGHLANYTIEDAAIISDIGTMATAPGATFGNGVALETVNEGGGREVKMYSELSSQVAYMQAMHRYRPGFIKKLDAMVEAAVAKVKADRGRVGTGAVVPPRPGDPRRQHRAPSRASSARRASGTARS